MSWHWVDSELIRAKSLWLCVPVRPCYRECWLCFHIGSTNSFPWIGLPVNFIPSGVVVSFHSYFLVSCRTILDLTWLGCSLFKTKWKPNKRHFLPTRPKKWKKFERNTNPLSFKLWSEFDAALRFFWQQYVFVCFVSSLTWFVPWSCILLHRWNQL